LVQQPFGLAAPPIAGTVGGLGSAAEIAPAGVTARQNDEPI